MFYPYYVVFPEMAICMASCFGNTDAISLGDIASILRGDVRVIAIGDSYSTAFWSRTVMSGMQTWPIPKISAVSGGAGIGPAILQITSTCSPFSNILSADSLGYTVERQNTDPLFFTLPIRGIKEIYGDETFLPEDSSGTLFEFRLNGDELNTSVHGAFSYTDDSVRFRLLYRSPSNPSQQPLSLKLQDDGKQVLAFDPRNDARKMWHLGEVPDENGRVPIASQINASATDLSVVNMLDSNAKVRLVENSPINSTSAYFQIAGGIYYHVDDLGNPREGFYYSSLADDSWEYIGHGSNHEGNNTHDKEYSEEQLLHWLDVTTLRREQPVVFMWMFNIEELTYENFLSQFTNMINQADSAADQVGITETYHLIITPHMSYSAGGGNEARAFIATHEQAAEMLASTKPNVATVSVYQETDGIYFNGTTTASQWLVDHGFDAFEVGLETINLAEEYYGNLLSADGLHPRNDDAASFFAAVVGNALRREGCPADVSVDGYIDVHDLLVVIETWGQDGIGDINNDGTTNVHDLLSTVESWGECWPVQAPFNTPGFRTR